MGLAKLNTADVQISSEPLEIGKLTNDGDLSLYFVGTGSAFTKTLGPNNLLVVKGEDHLLIDCGAKCPQYLHNAGLSIAEIDNFLITHSHADHVGGLEEVQLFGRYISRKKPSMVINEEYQQILWDQSLRGGSEMSEGTPLKFEDLWSIIRPKQCSQYPRETWQANVGGINVKMPRTKHIPNDAVSWEDSFWSVAVIIDDRVLFTSDTRFDPDLIEVFDQMFQFDLIFHDCQFFAGGVHASLQELDTLPRHLKQKIILMHFGDNWRDFEQDALDMGFYSLAKERHTYTLPTEDSLCRKPR